MRGYFGLAIYHPKNSLNWGTLFRTANILGAHFLTTIGPRFKRQASDVLKADRHVPVFEYPTFEDFYKHLPFDCRLVGVEMAEGAQLLDSYDHPERAVYLLGAEDHGLPKAIMDKCHDLIRLQGDRSLNLAVAGSIALYHRVQLQERS